MLKNKIETFFDRDLTIKLLRSRKKMMTRPFCGKKVKLLSYDNFQNQLFSHSLQEFLHIQNAKYELQQKIQIEFVHRRYISKA